MKKNLYVLRKLSKLLLGSVQGKLTLILIVLVTLPLLILGIISLRLTTEIIIANAEDKFALLTLDRAETIQYALQQTESDVLLLAEARELDHLLHLKYKPTTDEAEYQTQKQHVIDFFKQFLRSKQLYEEINYTDETGRQIVRVISDGQTARLAKPTELYNEANQPYFQETMQLASGEIFMSQLNLAREEQQLVQPFKPIIRQGTPVFDEQGQRRGVVFIYLFAEQLFPVSRGASHRLPGEVEFMIDRQGYYLLNSDTARAWSGPNNLNTGHRIQDDYPPHIVEAMLAGHVGVLDDGANSLISFAPVDPEPVNPDNLWIVADLHPKAAVLAPAITFRNIFLGFLSVTLGSILILSLLISRRLGQPLVALREGAEQIAQRSLDHRLTIKTGDEIEDLARAFNDMAARLQESYNNLEDKVAERTIELAERTLDLRIANEQLQSQEAHIRAIVETAVDGIITVDRQGTIETANSAITHLFGYSISEVIGQNFNMLISPSRCDDAELSECRDIHQAYGVGFTHQCCGHRQDGTRFPVEVAFSELDIDDQHKLTGVIRDMTEREQAAAELRLAYQNVKQLNNRFRDELTLAHKIQSSLLLPSRPQLGDLTVVCYTAPAQQVGGDFYAYHTIAPPSIQTIWGDMAGDEPVERYAVAVGDVSGKGLPAALLMAVSLTAFQGMVGRGLAPTMLLTHLDQAIVPYTKTTHNNCALCYIEIVPPMNSHEHGWRVYIANAGGIPPYIKYHNGQVEHAEVGGFALGQGLGSMMGYQQRRLQLSTGDLLVLTSDGVVEATNSAGDMLSFERLEQLIATGPTANAEAMLKHLQQAVYDFTGEAELHDDLTIVVVQL